MRSILTAIAILGLATPAFAGHASGEPPGTVTQEPGAVDRDGDGRTNGEDYAPGQSAQADDRADLNGDGKINGKDYAPGAIRNRQ